MNKPSHERIAADLVMQDGDWEVTLPPQLAATMYPVQIIVF